MSNLGTREHGNYTFIIIQYTFQSGCESRTRTYKRRL